MNIFVENYSNIRICSNICCTLKQEYPKAMEKCNISSIHKIKASRNDFNSYRGIFRVPIFRTVIDRLIYNDEYETIDEKLTDSNIGARKNRNVRDNILH